MAAPPCECGRGLINVKWGTETPDSHGERMKCSACHKEYRRCIYGCKPGSQVPPPPEP